MALMYWIQQADSVLSGWQTNIKKQKFFSIIISPPWSSSLLPTKVYIPRGERSKHWTFPLRQTDCGRRIYSPAPCACSTTLINTAWHTLWLTLHAGSVQAARITVGIFEWEDIQLAYTSAVVCSSVCKNTRMQEWNYSTPKCLSEHQLNIPCLRS